MAGKEREYPIARAAYVAWSQQLHAGRPAWKPCPLIEMVFRGTRVECGGSECPRACPEHPDHEVPPMRDYAPIPPMKPEELEAQRAQFAYFHATFPGRTGQIGPVSDVAVEYAREAPPDSGAAAPTSGSCVGAATDSTPENMPAPGDAAAEQAWAAAVGLEEPDDRETITPPPTVSDRQTITPEPWLWGLPPCARCGRHRPVMIVMAPLFEGGKGFRVCSRCFRGERVDG